MIFFSVGINTFYRIIFHIIFFLMLFPAKKSAQEFLIKNISKQDGLVQSTVHSIYQDQDGFVWIGTEEGISRFDGENVKNFTKPKDLFNHWIIKINKDSSGNLWILNRRGELWTCNKAGFSRICSAGHYIKSFVFADNNNLILLNYDGSVNILSHGVTMALPGLSEPVYNMFQTENAIIFAGRNRLYFYKGGKIYKNVRAPGPLISSIFTKDNILMAGHESNGIMSYSDAGWKKMGILNDKKVSAILQSGEGQLWYLTNEGLFTGDENKTTKFYPDPEKKDITIQTITVDNNGNIWCGTFGFGVFIISENLFRNYSNTEGLVSNTIFNIVIGKDYVLAGNGRGGNSIFADNRWKKFNPLSDDNNDIALSFYKDEEEKLFIAGRRNIYHYHEEVISTVYPLPGNGEFITSCFITTGDTAALVSFRRNGLWLIKKDKSEKLSPGGFAGNPGINSLAEIKEDIIMAGTRNNGLFILNNKDVQHYTAADGLSSNTITSFAERENGEIWIGTDKGINIIREGEIIDTLDRNDGMVSNTVYTLLADEKNVYIGTSDGLNIYDGKYFTLYDTDDGLIFNDINQNAFVKSKDNKLWIGTMGGISVFDMNRMNIAKELKPIIENVIVDRDTLIFVNESLTDEIFPGFESLTINFAIPYFPFSDKIISEYKLNENEWGRCHPEGKIVLKNLAFGSYNIYLRAKQGAGEWNSEFLLISFRVKREILNLYSVAGILFILLIFSVFFFYRKNKRKGHEREKYKTSSLSSEKVTGIKEGLEYLMKIKKIYLEHGLTLQKVADNLAVSKEHISLVINREYSMNFNDYVNRHRVEEAKRILVSPEGKDKKIMQVAIEAGFNSKNSFNSAFRKFTGKTPSAYKSEINIL